jgi:hypothetical protein
MRRDLVRAGGREPSPATPPAPESAPRCSFGGPHFVQKAIWQFLVLRAGLWRGGFHSNRLARIDIAFPANHPNGIHPSDLWLIPSLLASMDIQRQDCVLAIFSCEK